MIKQLRYIALASLAGVLACSNPSHGPGPTPQKPDKPLVGTSDAPLIGDAVGPSWANQVTGLERKPLPVLPGSQALLGYSGTAWNFSTPAAIVAAGLSWSADLVNSTDVAQYVSGISYSSSAAGGPVGIHGTGTSFVIDSGNTGFKLSQTQLGGTGNTAGVNLLFAAQQGQNAGGVTVDPSGGSILLVPGLPGTGGVVGGSAGQTAWGTVQVMGGASDTTPMVLLGDYAAAGGGVGSGVYGSVWFGTGSPTALNFGFLGNQSFTYLNVPTGGQLSLSFNGAGATGVDITQASGVVLALPQVQWRAGVTAPILEQAALASTSSGSGAAGQLMTLQAQAGQAATGASHNGGAGAKLSILSGAGGTSGSATAGAAGVLYLDTGAPGAGQTGTIDVGTTNATVLAEGSTNVTTFSQTVKSTGTITNAVGATTVLSQGLSAGDLAYFGTAAAQLELSPAQITWTAGVNTPEIIQAVQNSSTAPQNMLVQPQQQAGVDEGSAAANTPGSLLVNLGVPYTTTHAGNEAYVTVQRNGSNYVSFGGYYVSPAAYAQITLGPATSPTSDWTIISDGANSTYYNGYRTGYLQAGGSSIVQWTTSGVFPGSDNVYINGEAALRWKSVSAGPTGFEVWHASTDANPTAQLGDQFLSFGPGGTGGGSALDTRLVRAGAATVQLDNTSGGDGTLDVGGTSATGGHYIAVGSSTASISLGGTGTSGAQSASLTITPQTASTGAGSYSGNVVMNFSAPVSTATTQGMLVAQQGGTTMAGFGPYGSGYGGLWGGAGPFNTTNYMMVGNGTNTFINAGASDFVFVGFGGGGNTSFQFTGSASAAFSPVSSGGALNGTAGLYWNGTYSSSFQFPATLGSTGFVEWSGVANANANGQDTRVLAQQGGTVSSGTNTNGGNAWAISGAAGTGGTGGNVGSVSFGLGGTTNNIAFQGTGALGELLWSSAITPTLTQSSTSNATAANFTITTQASTASPGTPGNLLLNIPAPVGAGSLGYIGVQYNSTTYAKLYADASFNAWLVAPTANLNLEPAANDSVTIYDSSGNPHWYSFPTVQGNSPQGSTQTNAIKHYIADFHTTSGTAGQNAWTISTSSNLMYLVEVRWVSKDTSKFTAAGGRSTAVYENQSGTTLSLLGANTDVVEPASNNTITLTTSGTSIEVSVNPTGSGTDATDWEFEITLVID